MAALSAANLIRAWIPAVRAPAHRRLTSLLEATGSEAFRDDTLGERNRRLLVLHRSLAGTPLEARVKCPHCGSENEFAIPVDAILNTPAPEENARVRLHSGACIRVFRLPRMADIEAAGHASDIGEVRRIVVDQCRADDNGSPISDEDAEQLGREFETLDPAANIVVDITCSECARSIAASVDPAEFVARDIDRLVDGLYREIDIIASAYGWDELTILALPSERRRRYVAMIAARPGMRGGMAP